MEADVFDSLASGLKLEVVLAQTHLIISNFLYKI